MSDNKPVISDEAVEAAFRELPDGAGVYVNRDDLRVILESAAPHMLAGAWDEGHVAGDGDQSTMWDARNAGKPVKYADIATTNPYRSQA